MTTSSADPDALLAFATLHRAQAETLVGSWRTLQGAAERFHATCLPTPVMGADPLALVADPLHGIARRLLTLALDTGAVGSAFARITGPFTPGTSRTLDDPSLARLLGEVDRTAALAHDLADLAPEDRLALCAMVSPSVLEGLVAHHAALLGNLDGVPWKIRVEANHRRVSAELDLARLRGDTGLITLLEGLAATQILLFDPVAGRVAVLHGDLDRAHDLAVFVPGMGSTYRGFLTGASGTDDKGSAIYDASPHTGDHETAVISWLGYPAPSALPDGAIEVPLKNAASEGAQALEAFVASLDRRSGQRLTLVGHSYGTLVVGLAVAGGMGADDLVLAGSPGVGADHADTLREKITGDVYVLAAPGDPVAQLAWFGADPDAPDFGATRLTTNGPGSPRVEAHAHYFTPGSTSLANIAAVVSGGVPIRQETTIEDRARSALTDGSHRLTPGFVAIEELTKRYHGPGSGALRLADKAARQSEQTPARLFDAMRFLRDKVP